MPLAPCARCGKLFNKAGAPVCSACEADEQADYDKVRGILDKHPELATEEVAAHAEVDLAVVKRMLDQGIIAVLSGTEQVPCGRCGAPAISASKRLCQPCLEKLNTEMMRAQASIKLGEKKQPTISGFTVRETYEGKRR